MKHIDLKIRARHGSTIELPGGSVDQGAAERRDSSSAATTAPARLTFDPAEDDDQPFHTTETSA